MELKDFKDYTREEQKILLLQWWHNYGEVPYTSAELTRFLRMVEEEPLHVFNIAFGLDLSEKTSKYLIELFRSNKSGGGDLAIFSLGIRAFSRTKQFSQAYNEKSAEFISDLIEGYKHPDRNAKSTVHDVLAALRRTEEKKADKIIGSEGLTEAKVAALYNKCLLGRNDFDGEELISNFAIGEGIDNTSVFSAERLNKYRDKIGECISMLPKRIEQGIPFNKLTRNKNHLVWTGNDAVVDMLVQMGMATDMLYFPAPREDWEYLPGKIGYVAINQEYNKTAPILGQKPAEYTKTMNDSQGSK